MATRLIQQAEPIPGYRLVDRLGRGGFGEVWKVVAPGGVFKAIKFVHGDMENAGGDCRAAEQELKALNRIKTIRHPYILSIDRFDIIGGQLMIVMEMADRSVWERFEECRSLGLPGIPRDELLRYMDEAAEALDLMNFQHQIQHLDIKPQNLLLIHNHIKVADFGLAKDFEGMRGVVTGGITPVYAAPETSEGWISRFSDQYSLAIVYQELRTGIRPFSGTNAAQILIQHLTATPDVQSLPPGEREFVARALAKKPDERFASCTDFVRALRQCADLSADVVDSQTIPTASAPTPRNVRPLDVPVPAIAFATPGPTHQTLASPSADAQAITPPGVHRNRAQPASPDITAATVPKSAESGRARAGAEDANAGVLIPVYVVAAGKLGLSVLQSLRSQLLSRFNQTTFAHWRWLFIDTDEATIDASTSGSSRRALATSEVYHARMERPLQYMKRDGLPNPSLWMGNDTLYRIPRQPATAGIRCLGRLALLDHAQAIGQRIRSDLESLRSSAAIDEAADKTGLPIRSRQPRIYLTASLCGGTGAGMLIDLAYLLREQMRQLEIDNPQLTGLLLAPAPDYRAPGPLAIANSFATLAELNHWSQSSNSFESRFDTRQPSRTETSRPLDRCYLFELPRDSSVEVPPAAERAAELLLHETLTPLGRAADRIREVSTARHTGELPLHACGIHRIVFPRQRLLDAIDYRFAARILKDWATRNDSPARAELIEAVDAKWRECRIEAPMLAERLHQAAIANMGTDPETVIDRELATLAALSGKFDPVAATETIDRITALVGRAGPEEETVPGKYSGILRSVVEPLSKEADAIFLRIAASFVDRPDCRVAAADEVLRLLTGRLRRHIEECESQCDKDRIELEGAYSKMFSTLDAVSQAGPKRAAQSLADLQRRLQLWARQRIQLQNNRCVVAIYRQMLSLAPDCVRDANFCRKLMLDLAARLEREAEAVADSSASSERSILPAGCKTLLEAADRVIEASAGASFDFTAALPALPGVETATLATIGRAIKERELKLAKSIVRQVRAIVEPQLGECNPVVELLREQPDPESLESELLQAFQKCQPDGLGPASPAEKEVFILGATADEPGRRLKEAVRQLFADRAMIEADSKDEIVFYRERVGLSLKSLPQTGTAAVQAVHETKGKLRINPFSRIDVQWTSFMDE